MTFNQNVKNHCTRTGTMSKILLIIDTVPTHHLDKEIINIAKSTGAPESEMDSDSTNFDVASRTTLPKHFMPIECI